MENSNDRPAGKSIILHIPADLLKELDVLCANNYASRTAFIVAAFRLLIDRIEKQSHIPPWETSGASLPEPESPLPRPFPSAAYAPDDDEAHWVAAEDEDRDY